MAKEVDKDLNMLDKGPSEAEQLVDAIDQNPPASGGEGSYQDSYSGIDFSKGVSLAPEFKSQGDADSYMDDLVSRAADMRSIEAGSADEALDVGRGMFESKQDVRARNQSEGVKGIKAIGGGLLQGGLIALEQLGYVGDLDTYTNMFKEAEDLSGNWWTRTMKSAQESLRESDAFKIYEEAPDENSITSQIFKWSSLEGAVSSAVGFGITGYGATSLVAKLGATKNFTALGQMISKTTGIDPQSVRALAGPFASSVISNYYMGQMMATDTYNLAMEQLAPMIGEGEGKISKLAAQKIAANEAQDVVELNMMLVATSYLKFGSIFKKRRKDILIKDPTWKWQAKELIKKGSPTSFAENVYQEAIQMEQIHDAQIEAGGEDAQGYSDDYWTRSAELLLSNRAVHAGALGVVGGPIQFGIIQRPMMGKQLKQQREDYETQQKRITFGSTLVENQMNIFKQYDAGYKAAVEKGDIVEADFLSQSHLIHEIARQVEWGTMDILRKNVEDMISKDPTDEAVAGFDPDYKESGQKFLELLDSTEGIISRLGNIPNKGGVVYNSLVAKEVIKSKTELDTKIAANESKLEAAIKQEFKDRKVDIAKLEFTDRAADRFKGLTPAQITKLKTKEASEDLELVRAIRYREEFIELEKDKKRLKKFSSLQTKLGEQLLYMLSEEGKAKFIKEQQQAVAEAPAAVEALNEKKKKEVKESKNKDWTSFEAEKARDKKVDPKILEETAEEIDTQITESKKKNEFARVREGETFTSIDSMGNVRNYSPHDIVYSEDGGMYRVVYQYNKNAKDMDLRGRANMPVLKKVKFEKGRWVADGKMFVLLDNSWLRTGVLQGITTKEGKYSHHSKDWRNYRVIDTVLKPNLYSFNTKRIQNVAEGKVNSVNIFEGSFDKPGYEWASNYRLDLLDKPFEGDYDVELRLNTSNGPNDTFVDVYVETENGMEPLTRLNRDYNLAHEDIVAALSKGEKITATVKNHYSSKRNLAKNRDNLGNLIYTPVADFANANNKFLINGSVVLAQTKGPNGTVNVNAARALDGTLYDGESNFITVDGVDKEVPYSTMVPGDTYALVLGSGNRITPIPLRSKTLREIESSKGLKNRAMDILETWQDSINKLLKEEIDDQVAKDAAYWAEVNSSNAVHTEEQRTHKFKFLKRGEFFKKMEKAEGSDVSEGYEAMKEGILKYVRSTKYKGKHIVTTNEDGSTEVQRDRNNRPIINPDYIDFTVDVASDLSYVPGIEIANPKSPSKTMIVNPIDHTELFMDKLEGRKARMSIDLLHDQDIQGQDAANAMMQHITENGLNTDVDMNTMFRGSSADIELHAKSGEVYGERAAKSLKKASKAEAPAIQKYVEVTSEETKKEFNSKIDTMLTTESVDIKLDVLSSLKNDEEVIQAIKTIVESLGIKEDVDTLINERMNDSPETTERLQELEGKISVLNINDPKLVPMIAKGAAVIQDIQAKVNAGELTLITAQKVAVDSRFIQVEGKTNFGRNTVVWHAAHGEGVVTKTNAKGMIYVSFNKRKAVPIYPANIYTRDSVFRKLASARRALNKLRRQGTTDGILYDAAVKKVDTLETKTTALTRKAYGEKSSDTSATAPEVTGDFYNLLETATKLGMNKLMTKFEGTVNNSARASKIAEKLAPLTVLRDKINSHTNLSMTLEEDFIIEFNKAFLDAVPYTDKERLEFKELVENNIDRGINLDINKAALDNLDTLDRIVNILKAEPNLKEPTQLDLNVYSRKLGKSLPTKIDLMSAVTIDLELNTPRTTDYSAAKIIPTNLYVLLGEIINYETEIYASRFATQNAPKPKNNNPNKDGKNPGTTVSTERVNQVKNVVSSIQDFADGVKGLYETGKLTDPEGDFKWYVHDKYRDKNGDYIKFERVTSTYKKGGTETSTIIKNSQDIGRGIDNLMRDYFDGVPIKYDAKYGIDEGSFKDFKESLDVFKKNHLSGHTVIGSGIILFDQVSKTAGAVDLLSYDSNGDVYIWDVKTMRYNLHTEQSGKYQSTVKFKGGKVERGASRMSTQESHRNQVSAYRIILNNNYGILAKGVGIVPIKVNYDTKKRVSMAESAVVLPILDIKGANIYSKVGPLKLDLTKTKAKAETGTPPKGNFNAGKFGKTNAEQNSRDTSYNLNHVEAPTKKDTKQSDGDGKSTKRDTMNPEDVVDPNLDFLSDNGVSDLQVRALTLHVAKGTEGVDNLIDNAAEMIKMNLNPADVIDKYLEGNNLLFKLKSKTEEFNNPDFQKEVNAVKKVLPNLNLEVIKDLTYMTKTYGADAVGAYNRGVMQVLQGSEQGTVFHEAFHAVADLYLSPSERTAIAKERGYDKWDITLEEKLAEEFEEFYKNYKANTGFKGFLDRASRFFRSIIEFFTGKPKYANVEDVFRDIVEGGFKGSPSKTWFTSSLSGINDLVSFEEQLSNKNILTLQILKTDNRIKIKC